METGKKVVDKLNAVGAKDFIDNLTRDFFGVPASERLERGECPACGKPITQFRDALSEKEYRLSGLCQECQDEVFGK